MSKPLELREPSPYEPAPLEWRYALFPLEREGEEILSLEAVVHRAEERLTIAETRGDRTPLGPVYHWAHILKSVQEPDGAWPSVVNARTGETVGTARTRAPASLMGRLDRLLNACEYEATIARAYPPGMRDDTSS